MNKRKTIKFTDIENKLVVTIGVKKEGQGNRDKEKGIINTGLYEIMCMKSLKIIEHNGI